jgi:hypothetical protein
VSDAKADPPNEDTATQPTVNLGFVKARQREDPSLVIGTKPAQWIHNVMLRYKSSMAADFLRANVECRPNDHPWESKSIPCQENKEGSSKVEEWMLRVQEAESQGWWLYAGSICTLTELTFTLV